jgi:hypothetical protein
VLSIYSILSLSISKKGNRSILQKTLAFLLSIPRFLLLVQEGKEKQWLSLPSIVIPLFCPAFLNTGSRKKTKQNSREPRSCIALFFPFREESFELQE